MDKLKIGLAGGPRKKAVPVEDYNALVRKRMLEEQLIDDLRTRVEKKVSEQLSEINRSRLVSCLDKDQREGLQQMVLESNKKTFKKDLKNKLTVMYEEEI